MANRATKFVSAIVVCAAVGIPVSTFAKDAAAGLDASTTDSSTPAASSSTECLTTPNRESSPGQHWFYRMEPGTNRRCWFLRDQPERASQTASPRSNSSQSPFPNAAQSLPTATPAPPKSFSRNAQALRSESNARAEFGPRSTGQESAGLTVPKTPVFVTTGSAGTNRGASQGTEAAVLSSSESTDASVTGPFPDTMAASGQNASFNLNTGLSSASEMPAMANMPQEKASASLQVLFLVILGALGFAGIIASLTHRMPRLWRRHHARSRRRAIWPGVDGGRRGSWVTAASPGRHQDRRATGAQRHEPSGQIKQFLSRIAKQAGGSKSKKRPAKPQAASAARVRTPSTRRDVRASAVRP